MTSVPVNQVIVSPDETSVLIGADLQLSAETLDSIGGTLAGRAVA